MSQTYIPLATTTLGSAQASVTFSNISGSYTDLILVRAGGGTSTASTIYVRFNGNTASNYSDTSITGYSTTAASGRASNQTKAAVGGSWGSNNTTFLQIQNYSNTTTNKTMLYRFGDTTDTIGAGVALWRQTSAITSIELSLDSTFNFTSGSTFTLYGIRAA